MPAMPVTGPMSERVSPSGVVARHIAADVGQGRCPALTLLRQVISVILALLF
jgi:hypothetical protein